MSDIVPACYQSGASFKAWACSPKLADGKSVRQWLKDQRDHLLEEIDWESWDPEQSRKLCLLDHLLDV